MGELPNSIFTDEIVGVGVDSDSPNIVQKLVSNQVVWHKTCRESTDTQKVQRARKRSGPEVVISPVKTRRLSGESSTSLYKPIATPVCFFCDEVGSKQELRKASTLGLDTRVRDRAQMLGDKRLLRKFSSGDMVVIDAVYHRACLTRFYRKAETVGCDMTESYKTQVI